MNKSILYAIIIAVVIIIIVVYFILVGIIPSPYVVDYLLNDEIDKTCANQINVALSSFTVCPFPVAVQGYVIWNAAGYGHVTVVYNSLYALNKYGDGIRNLINQCGPGVYGIDYQGYGNCNTVSALIPSNADILIKGWACQNVVPSGSPAG